MPCTKAAAMTTDIRTAEKFLTYDGDCPMCIASVGALVNWGLVRPEQTRANHDLDPLDAELARESGIRNQLVVIDPNTREARVGTAGLLWIIGETPGCGFVARLLSLPVLRQLLSFGYKAVSYNRRIISPPRHQIVCDCEPQVTVGRRLTLIVPLIALSVLIVAAWGAAVFVGCQLGTAATGAVLANVATLSGWTIMSLAGFAVLGGMRGLDYLGHLAVTMFAGALILLAATVVIPWIPRPSAAALAILSLMYCFSKMYSMQRHRAKATQLPLAWLWGWTVVMLLAFGATTAIYLRDRLA
jgi:predicted DCC family thiol-disulfide oxidoreductase YuxK